MPKSLHLRKLVVYLHTISEKSDAQMAESVDALVSNTSRFTPVPVRPRLWVLKTLVEQLLRGFLLFKTSKMVTFGHHYAKGYLKNTSKINHISGRTNKK